MNWKQITKGQKFITDFGENQQKSQGSSKKNSRIPRYGIWEPVKASEQFMLTDVGNDLSLLKSKHNILVNRIFELETLAMSESSL